MWIGLTQNDEGMSFFKSNKYSVFEYKPRKYDAKKERRNKLIHAKTTAEKSDLITNNMRHSFERRRNKNKLKSPGYRVILIAILLLVIILYIFEINILDFLPKL